MKLDSRRQKIMFGVVLSLAFVALITENLGGMVALLLFLVGMLQVHLLKKVPSLVLFDLFQNYY